jgi:hypothetical protein
LAVKHYVLFLVGFIILFIVASCGPSAAPTATPAPLPPPATALPTVEPLPTPIPADLTAAEIAVRGMQVYARSCGVCHDSGFAGSLDNGLRRFPDAGAMFSYARSAMPQNNPGSLLPEEYFAVIVDVLLQAKLVAPDAILDPNKLSDIKF